jgi:hypothetical protein
VLLDEADHNLPSRAGTRNELIQMINSGHKRATAVVIRTESVKTPNGTVQINRRYPIFAPVAMAGIGTFAPTTTRSRCYEIRLKRKMRHEEVDTFIPDDHAGIMREMRAKIHRFVADNRQAIRECRPVMDSDLLHNRQRDNSGTLLMIADTIGGQIPSRARAAITAITRSDAQDIYEVLLEDIASILLDPTVIVNYAGAGQPPNMRRIGWNNTVFSSDLCDLIVQYFPHRETYTAFTTARLATMLSRFEIQPEPRVKRRGSDNGTRWYRRDAFDEWFTRYGFESPEAARVEPGEPGDTPAEGATPIHNCSDEGTRRKDALPTTPPSASLQAPSQAMVEAIGEHDRPRAAGIAQQRSSVNSAEVPQPIFALHGVSADGETLFDPNDPNADHWKLDETTDNGKTWKRLKNFKRKDSAMAFVADPAAIEAWRQRPKLLAAS